jgi:hypothetical protein
MRVHNGFAVLLQSRERLLFVGIFRISICHVDLFGIRLCRKWAANLGSSMLDVVFVCAVKRQHDMFMDRASDNSTDFTAFAVYPTKGL